jgi:hypothetical protein
MSLKSILLLPLAVSMAISGMAQTPSTKNDQPTSTTAKKVERNPAPTAKDIADAKAKGLVWVNTSTKVYHKDGQFYGNTKKGKFMTEDEAKKAGYRAAEEPVAKKAKTDTKK